DYALATHGATILPLWTSSTFSPNEQQHWWTRWYSLPSPVSSPKMALTPGMHAGQCWPMNGNHGSLGIRLSEPTVVRAVSVDYPGHQVFASQVSSAPKQMELWGLVHLDDMNDAVFLGSFTYQINKSSPRQTFDLDNAQSLVFPGVVLRIRSNWGNQQHTCLYHISVHGTP
ncbi:UNC-like C-terminal-domain-containing protein, partial [Chlamydoabsidia padenii]